MCDADRELVDDVLTLRNQLRRTERNLQALGEQLSRSKNDSVAEQNPRGSDGVGDPSAVNLDGAAEPDMQDEVDLLRRNLGVVREQNSSLVLENRRLIGDLENAQLEIASVRSKMRVLGSTVDARTSSVSVMSQRILDMEAQLDAQTAALREAELKRAASEHDALQCSRTAEKLREDLKVLRSELCDGSRQWKRTEQQRNQALQNAERLGAAFRDFKEDVGEKLKKVMENEGMLKASLIECDRERDELEKRCTELERDRARTSHSLSKDLEEARVRCEAALAERHELQGRVQAACETLGRLQGELQHKDKQLEEMEAVRREREDLRLLTACQEQRLLQTGSDMEQVRAELASLENLLDMLHLRESRDGEFCANPCLLPSLPFASHAENPQHKPGERYQKLLAALRSAEKETARRASAAHNLQERLSRAQDEISSLQTSIAQRAAHYQQMHNQLLDKAAQATTLEKELKKKSSRVMALERQVQEKSAAYSQAAVKSSRLEQEIMEKDSSIHHYQSLLKKKQREHQHAMENSKMAQVQRCGQLEDRIEALQLSLAQSQAEVAAVKRTASELQAEKQEVEHQAGLLQASVDQLTREMEMQEKQSEEARRAFEEQAFESTSKMKQVEAELRGGVQEIQKVTREFEKQLEMKNSELSVLQEALRSRALACSSSSEENRQLQRSMQRQQAMLQESTGRIAQLEDNQSLLQNQVSQLEQDLERERSTSSQQIRRKQAEVEEAQRDARNKEKQTSELSASITKLSSEMNACREELKEMEKELLRLRRDSSAKATQLGAMEETLQETRGMLDKKSDMVQELEEKLHRSETDRRDSLQRAHALGEQLDAVRGELADTLGHLEELRDVLQRTQLTAEQRHNTIQQLAAELRESQRELEERNHEVLDMDTALKERQGELQQRAELLGQLDALIKEHKLEMERKVEHLQDVLEKAERRLGERDEQVGFLTERLDLVKSQLQGKEDLEKSTLELGQQLRVCREQLQKSAQDLQDAHTRYDTLSAQLDIVTHRKETDVQQLHEQLRAAEKRRLQGEAQLQVTITELQRELEQQREEHNREVSALQQTRGQLLKVSDQISLSLRSSQEQLEKTRADAADLHAQLRSTQQLLQHSDETLLVKDSEIARLQAKISSLERASELHHGSGALPPLSPPLKDPSPGIPAPPLGGSGIWTETSSDVSLELSESLKAGVKAALSSPASGWQGLHPELSSSTDMTFNPLTYMLDAEEPEEPDPDSLSGMLRFVNQTLALQEQHSGSHSAHG